MAGAIRAARVLVIAEGGGLAYRALAEGAQAQIVGVVPPARGAAAIREGGFDLLIGDLRRATLEPALVDALAEVATGTLLLDREQLDEAGALAFSGLELLCQPDSIAMAGAVQRALLAVPRGGVREESEEDRAARLRRISEAMERLARSLGEMADAPARSPYVATPARAFRGAPALPVVDAGAIRALIRARRAREQYFDAALFADPAWDMMLDLMAARLEGAEVSVSSLCIAAAVPPTTALRWIKQLAETGLIMRVADRRDRRRVFIALSETAAEAMAACLSTAARGGSLPI